MAARCAFCGADLHPNSMFCLTCGQLVAQAGGPVAGRGGAVGVPAPVPVAPAPAPAPPAVACTLRFDTGQVLVVDGPVLVGRRPEPTAAERGVEGFAVADPAKSMSRVHAGLHVDSGRLVVTDQGSGNGTLVRRGASEVECEPEVPVVLASGDVVEFGSVTATVS